MVADGAAAVRIDFIRKPVKEFYGLCFVEKRLSPRERRRAEPGE